MDDSFDSIDWFLVRGVMTLRIHGSLHVKLFIDRLQRGIASKSARSDIPQEFVLAQRRFEIIGGLVGRTVVHSPRATGAEKIRHSQETAAEQRHYEGETTVRLHLDGNIRTF